MKTYRGTIKEVVIKEDKNYKKILELNERYGNLQEDKLRLKSMIKFCEQQMDRLKKEIANLSNQ